MTNQIFYIYGFSFLLLTKVYAVYWNETDFLNVDGRESRRIRNKFMTFDTTETDIELAFQFNVPFVAVPTDRSLSNMKNSIASFANLNLGSIALASVMILFGSITSFLWTTFIPKSKKRPSINNNDNNNTTATEDGTTNIDDSTNTMEEEGSPSEDDNPKSERVNESNEFLNLMNLLEATLNPSVCLQQYICLLSRSTSENVTNGNGSSSDKIISGIFGTPWILDIITGSAIHDAIQFGESRGDCLAKFSRCSLGVLDSEEIFNMFLKSLNVIK